MTTSEGYATDGDGDGFADVWNPADAIAGAARLLRANGAPADYRRALYAYNHATRTSPPSSRRRTSTAARSPRVPQAELASCSPGPSLTSAASPTTSGRRPIAAARCRTCRAASRRARRATARCSRAGRSRRPESTSGRRPQRSGPRTASCPRATAATDGSRHARRRLRSAARRLPARRPDLLRRRRRPERPRRALARQRDDRPVLVERQRLEHPAARRLRRTDRLGALASWLKTGALPEPSPTHPCPKTPRGAMRSEGLSSLGTRVRAWVRSSCDTGTALFRCASSHTRQKRSCRRSSRSTLRSSPMTRAASGADGSW